ncbi:MAG: glycosyltransferase [Bacteroidales bacterium]|nr:glycosyltransferase [Lachnoclostridium sp.]MCM1384722.1 glycosyltransferase [Lachnoclostridium sp.]MCM1465264.1 glycosyltransferase [Bacteroidales bacterium]
MQGIRAFDRKDDSEQKLVNNKRVKGKWKKAILAAGLIACGYAVWNYIAKRKKESIEFAGNEKIQKQMGKDKTNRAQLNGQDAGFEDYGYLKHFDIDTGEANQKRVLITGAGSYIGTSFESWAKEHYPVNFSVDTVDMRDADWRKKDFSSYDVVFHVAGIAHADVGKVSEEEKKNYYAVNTDLAIEAAQKAKAEGVKQFIFMSSMIVYGDSAPYGKEKVINENTAPTPANFYGDSKWQADKGVRALASEDFRVAVLRPPMIYGEGSKGNYPVLVKLAKTLPIFPNVKNCRSMLYIDNLCEFLCKLMLSGQGGVYFPQNKEYTETSEMVKQIAEAADKKLWVTGWLNPAVIVGSYMPGKISGLVNKAFGNASYTQKLSTYEGLDYQKTSLKESIKQTDGRKQLVSKGSVLILVNHDVVIYNFRLELVERLLAEGYEVHISSPYGERIDDLIKLGAIYHEIDIDRHGMNPLKEISLLWEYKKLMRMVRPFVVLGYTIKPNIYGALAAKAAGVPFIANITGLGSAVENPGWKQKAMIALYKISFTKVQRVFFQNEENKRFFEKYHIAVDKHALLPGSGVNLTRYPVMPLAECGNGKEGIPIKFAFISRIMKEKGIDQYLEAAERVKQQYPATEFHVCGFCEEEYEGKLKKMEKLGVIKYHGMIRDVAGMMSSVHCIVHPTYYPEGLSNILLEACSCARAIITTDRAGCREVVENGRNGYMVAEKNVSDLIGAIKQFIELSQKEKTEMGLAGRKLVEEHYDRQIVVDRYMEEIEKI